ncbi:YidH family protein [Micrococcoides hystricis]|uniref:YidH family protein n=1 Tax=Micrococcoides hystricis TaxID=1572761 RepID=A0ABV6P9S1_9MICC
MAAQAQQQPERSKMARRLLAGGDEPDPRFTLANERTFLAWIRTSLALVAGAIAIEGFTEHLLSPSMRLFLGAALAILALMMAIVSAMRWLQVERALRHRRALPLPVLVPLITLALAGAILGFLMFLFGWFS